MKARAPRKVTEVALAAFVLATGWAGAAAQEPIQAVAPVVVEEVEVRGNDRIAAEVIQSTAGIQRGEEITYRAIQDAIRNLWNTDEFADVEVYAAEVDPSDPASPVRLIIEVVEHPYVAYVEFQGLEHVRPGTVRDSVGLRAGRAYDPARATRAEAVVRNLLADKGIRLQSIEHRLEPIEGVEDEYRLVFDVAEGTRVAVTQVEIRGNEVFSDAQIRGAMSTREEGFFWFRSGLYDETTLRADLRSNLPSFYGARGYIDFTVVRDTLIVDPETGKGRLEIEVQEGPQYRLVDFEIRGNRQFPTDQLRQYYGRARGGLLSGFGITALGAQEGQRAEETPVFNRVRFDQATEDVHQLYRNSGYLYAQVVP
ncbi:MAG: POTRA domain-containing protein, partial [Gemmatimonadota bacterium]